MSTRIPIPTLEVGDQDRVRVAVYEGQVAPSRQEVHRGVVVVGAVGPAPARQRLAAVDPPHRRFERPESEGLRQQDEAWRVVPDALWERVQAKLEERGARMRTHNGYRVPAPESARRRHLLSGLLECAECGGAFHALYRGTFGCSWRRDRGPEVCGSALRVDGEELHARVLGAIREQILNRVAVAHVEHRRF